MRGIEMKQVAKSLVVVGAMLAAGSAIADMDMDFKPFIGVDYLQAWMEGKGVINNTNVNVKDAFKKSFPGATVYVGSKFTENFGIELGADWSTAKTKSVAGNTNVTGNTFTYTNKARREGFHADLVGFLPIDCWELFGSLGYGSVKMKLSNQAVTSTGTAAQQAAFNGQFPLSTKRKGVFRVGVGASYMFTDMFGVRAKLGWEGTEALRLQYANGVANSKAFKNSTTLAAGVFVRW